MSPLQAHEALAELAGLYGIQLDYWDASGTERRPSDEAVVAVLAALGAPVTGLGDLADAARERRTALWSRLAEPIAAVVADEPAAISLRAPAWATGPARATITLEDGGERAVAFELGSLPVASSCQVDGEERRELLLRLPEPLPAGYHDVRVETGGEPADVLVIAAPRHAPSPRRARAWGVFLPVYALRSERTMGIADLADVERLLTAVDGLGGSLAGSTPLLAAFPGEPSPYAPASRLFWNETYADLGASPELERSAAARALLESSAYRSSGRSLAEAPYADYQATHDLRRPVLEALADTLFSEPSPRRDALEAHLRANPRLADYARFRATGERHGSGWPVWPEAERDGELAVADDDPAFRYHVYSQWLVDEQLAALARRDGAGLYLDQPLGVHSDSYDTWRERGSFALGASGGSPPDQFFAEGQEWGFPPMHPQRIREDRLRYPIACLRQLLGRARALRIDHVMGLHRLFWVPRGYSAADGVYVDYHAEELYAILCLEAERAGTMVVGEDLGTVPDGVRETMDARGVRRSYVLQFSVSPDPQHAIEAPPRASLATANTHDTPLFAAFWRDAEPALRHAVTRYLRQRGRLPDDTDEADADAVLRACLADMASVDVETVLVTLEDLWGELEPQNVPGTSGEDATNWRRRAHHSLEEMFDLPGVRDTLHHIDGLRQQGMPA
jgi:4-alpha-glucanotransferase